MNERGNFFELRGNNENAFDQECAIVRGKIDFLSLPRDVQDSITELLESFINKDGYDKISKIKQVQMECDMLMNYRTLLAQKIREKGDEKIIHRDIEEIMKKAGAALAEIRRLLMDDLDDEHIVH